MVVKMCIEDKYKKAYLELEKLLEEKRRHQTYYAFGYTSNLDLICDFDIEQFNDLLDKYIGDYKNLKLEIAGKIRTIEELLETISYYCVHGIGGEVDIENVELINQVFSYQTAIGGTGVQAAMALANIGCSSIVHLTDDSEEVCNILQNPYVYTVDHQKRLVHTDEVSSIQEQEVHFIIQFKKGDRIKLGNWKKIIPCSNRLILTKVTVNEEVPFHENYFWWIERNAKFVHSNVLSSFNCIQNRIVLEQRLNQVEKHIKRYREQNPEGIVYFEDAHYHSEDIKKMCMDIVYSSVDIVSMNEEELYYTSKMYGVDVDLNDVFSCICAMEMIRNKFAIKKGVVVHTKDYSMYVGSKMNANIENGLIYGNMVATAKAQAGTYGSLKSMEEVLKLDLSQKGIECYEKIQKSEYRERAILVPSKYIDKPRYTIGLGDSFVGGFQLCFG